MGAESLCVKSHCGGANSAVRRFLSQASYPVGSKTEFHPIRLPKSQTSNRQPPQPNRKTGSISGRNRHGEDLLVFSPTTPLRFNFLGYVLSMGGHTRDVTRCITVIGETLRAADTTGGENADFWEREQERMIYNAVEIVTLASGSVSAPSIQRFISTAAMNPAQIACPQWRAGFCNQCLADAFGKQKTGIQSYDYQLASDYWLSEFPAMSDKTRLRKST